MEQSGLGVVRLRLVVRGIVQGVGFRPFVYGLALHHGLGGYVRNDASGVTIEVEGAPERVAAFAQALEDEAPPLARIDSVHVEPLAPGGEREFRIVKSVASVQRRTLISPDVSTCDACRAEIFDPADRRFHYPFTNCTNCGPRFTIVLDVPYDRANTTMAAFPMCPRCAAEYADPTNRRFHAQPNACPDCGPRVRLLNEDGAPLAAADPIAAAAVLLARGRILAVKGLGGYHLAVDALNSEAVTRLRRRKRRGAKPFALMALDLDAARRICAVTAVEAALLTARQRPIVLLDQIGAPAVTGAPARHPVAEAVAPGQRTLGVMLPYTPLHHLLMAAFAEAIGGAPAVLVMTSGNLSDEPICYRDEEAGLRLRPLVDGWLVHNRDIHMRCDDSVVRRAAGDVQYLRRARGYAPEPMTLAAPVPTPLLACGAHLKNTFCLARGTQAFVSHHIGDLENLETLASYEEAIAHYGRLFDIEPQAVAYDLHPDYLATKYALGLPQAAKIGVQHHHAHIASVLAEHGLAGPVIGVAADGAGYGVDGAVWGGEVLLADAAGFTRLGHLAYTPMPGGEQAIRQPWRMAVVHLHALYGERAWELELPFLGGVREQERENVLRMAAAGLNSPLTSSLGRLFDAAAALLNLRREVDYEGQAAMELEAIAAADQEGYPFGLEDANEPGHEAEKGAPFLLDGGALLAALVEDACTGLPAGAIAGRFHAGVADMLAAACVRARAQSGVATVALSGGVFQNRLLLELLWARLESKGFRVYTNRRVPPNDGGVSLGQLAVAAARLATGRV